ncbi:hypothetical protein FGO68_gene121 [Halteria grandinella]|uniref:Transmembrane protein n=1 Tax=Halteria grandinella TaxID=5974 RepID=A0A8J8P7S1_HALGN|nr:hypothetical protein FGO68_gene121 [Halteria grandinella]
MNIKFQSNAELVYGFLDSNSNMYFSCSNDQNQVSDPNKTDSFFTYTLNEPYSQQFEAQGYTSMIVFENIGATVSNMGNVLLVTAVVMVALWVLQSTSSFKHQVLDIVRKMFIMNYFMKFVIENSLRIYTFSLVNMMNTEKDDFWNPNIAAAWFTASLFIYCIFAIAIFNIRLVHRMGKVGGIEELQTKYPQIESLYVGLRETKEAKMFWSVFIIRRIFLSFVCVMLNEYQALQIHLLMAQSVWMFYYLYRYRPFLSDVENVLSLFNECVIIAAINHMMVFSEAFNGETDLDTKIGAGWSFNYLILVQILVNLALYLGEAIYKGYVMVRRKYLQYRDKQRKGAIQKAMMEESGLQQLQDAKEDTQEQKQAEPEQEELNSQGQEGSPLSSPEKDFTMKRIQDDKALVTDYLSMLHGGLSTFNGLSFSTAHQAPPTISELLEQAPRNHIQEKRSEYAVERRRRDHLKREQMMRDNKQLLVQANVNQSVETQKEVNGILLQNANIKGAESIENVKKLLPLGLR